MEWSAHHLNPLLAIATASIHETGALIEANQGFLRIINAEESQAGQLPVAQFFIQPAFATLANAQAGADGEIHRGLLTIGDYMGKTRSLRGCMWRDGARLHLLAEHDIAELERIQDTVLRINSEYANAQLQLAQTNQKVQQLNAHLEQRVAERTRELSDALKLAETANRAKSLFLANMSHELRTPMNGIMGLTDIALRRASDPKQVEHLKESKSTAQRLLAIINDIIDMSNLVADKFDIESIDFTLPSVFDTATAPLAARARARGLTLSSQIDPALPPALRGDPGRINQVLSHLLGNALKFSENGSITLGAILVKAQDDDVLVRIEVADQGIGISEEAQGRIFNLFEQSDNSFTREHGGMGLGLAICKHLIKLMGGEMGVRSTPGQGSTFWATVPLKLGKDPVVASDAALVALSSPAHDLLAPASPENGPDQPAIDWSNARQVLGELKDLLAVGDFGVSAFCEDHARLIDGVLEDKAREFNEAAANYDWEVALRLLQAVMDSCPQLHNAAGSRAS